MIKDLTFKDVCKFVKEDDAELLEKADIMLSAVMIFSSAGLSLFTTLPVMPILTLLTTKNELVKIGKYLFQQITKKTDANSLDKFKRMETTYILICYTAFFEALDDLLENYPTVKETFKLNLKQKLKIVDETSKQFEVNQPQCYQLVESSSISIHDGQIFLPNPSGNFENIQAQLIILYKELTKGFETSLGFSKEHPAELYGVYVVEDPKAEVIPLGLKTKKEADKFFKQLQILPKKALENFEAQYYDLSSKYNEFYTWANLQEHKKTRKDLSVFLKGFTAFVKDTKTNIDVGLNKLSKTVESIPNSIEKDKADKVFISLTKYYENEIDKSVIKKEEHIVEDEKPMLRFPKRSEIFIPQSFKVIYVGNRTQVSLEDNKTWSNAESRNDLGAFLINYLSSPYSVAAPLIILGHPGSGKSLLTQMLAAKLSLPNYSPIRVELRNVNADSEIDSQIEEQIHRDTGREIKFVSYSEQFQDFPPLVMLDGYDELLQASGKVFGNYLTKAQKFQEREYLNERPLRIIVTSRITLIDKATIPQGATIIKLEEFDEPRRTKWIDVWNNANKTFFEEAKIKPFSLSKANENILSLAEQPLLLLMLALYDSDGNKLLKETDIKQTELYYNLIYRFIEREKLKDEHSKPIQIPLTKLKPEIEKDLDRLGVVALGMFNRRNLHILTNQLDKDLAFFNLQKETTESSGRDLKQSDFVLGSFFFVHKSKSEFKGDVGETETESAFEFLHNTFGEFLTADFILNNLISEVELLVLSSSIEALNEQARSNPIGLSKLPNWFAGLIYTPLFSRPVILEMMREWIHHKLKKKDISFENFVKEFDYLINKQINLLLSSDVINNAIKDNCKDFCVSIPYWGHLAIYSINLIILRTVLSDKDFVFKPTLNDDGTNSWEQLTHIWRAWFSLENLNELTAIFTTKIEDDKIILNPKKQFVIESGNERFDLIQNVSSALADRTTSSLTSLFSEPHLFLQDEENALGNIRGYLMPLMMRERFIHDIRFREEIEKYFFRYLDNDIAELIHSSELKFRLKGYECIGIINNLIIQTDKLINIRDFDERYNDKFFHYYFRLIEKLDFEEMFRYYPDIFGQLFNYLFNSPHSRSKEFDRLGHNLMKTIRKTMHSPRFYNFLQITTFENFLIFLLENDVLEKSSSRSYLLDEISILHWKDYRKYEKPRFRNEENTYLQDELFQMLILPTEEFREMRSPRRRFNKYQHGLSTRFIYAYLRAIEDIGKSDAFHYFLETGYEFYVNDNPLHRDSPLLASKIVDLIVKLSDKFEVYNYADGFFSTYVKFIERHLNFSRKDRIENENNLILSSNLSDVRSLCKIASKYHPKLAEQIERYIVDMSSRI